LRKKWIFGVKNVFFCVKILYFRYLQIIYSKYKIFELNRNRSNRWWQNRFYTQNDFEQILEFFVQLLTFFLSPRFSHDRNISKQIYDAVFLGWQELLCKLAGILLTPFFRRAKLLYKILSIISQIALSNFYIPKLQNKPYITNKFLNIFPLICTAVHFIQKNGVLTLYEFLTSSDFSTSWTYFLAKCNNPGNKGSFDPLLIVSILYSAISPFNLIKKQFQKPEVNRKQTGNEIFGFLRHRAFWHVYYFHAHRTYSL